VCARCRRTARYVDAGASAGAYEGALREIIHAFKYDGRRTLARRLGALIGTAAQDLLRDAYCVVPVPLHPWRRLVRGFNQAADLAAGLGPPLVAALWRTRTTASQTGLHAAARRRNVQNAIVMSRLLRPRTVEQYISGRIVVVVDDVRTTGATLEACARALKAAGASEVRTATVATSRPRVRLRSTAGP
jgi:ComF family protein